MAKPKIVIVGGGGVTFVPRLLVDFVHCTDLHGGEIVLVDINAEAVDKTCRLGQRLFEAAGVDLAISATTDRVAALPGADYVITTVEIDRYPTWRTDYAIPQRFGVEQALGENGGPGGLFHALRIVPVVVDICQDVARLAPDALVLNLTNPMSRVCKGIDLYTTVNFVGLCHEIKAGREHLSYVLDRPEEDIATVAAGLNHFTWFLQISDAETGADLYPAVREAYPGRIQIDRLLTADIFRQTGTLCVTSDSHCGEYIPGGHLWETAWAPGTEPMPFKVDLVAQMGEYDAWEMGFVLTGQTPPEEFFKEASGEQVVDIIRAHWHDRPADFAAVNVPNRGFIPNLPDGAIVEVPGRVDGTGVHGMSVDPLPEPMAAWCHPQVAIHALTAKAAVEGDRQAALDVLLVDPTVPSLRQAEQCLDAMLDANRTYLPRFFD